MSKSTHPVLTPFALNNLALRNRAVVAPLSRVSTRGDGVPTASMVDYYRRYAEGGFGLIITEGTYTDTAFAQSYSKQPGMVNDSQAGGWQQVVDAVHDAGGAIVMQLMHAGALSQYLPVTAGPSTIRPLRKKMAAYGGEGEFAIPQAMNFPDIATAVQGFVDSARRAKAVGFDGVEIHGANGYLLDQFLTHYTNARNDQYGGTVKNRVRLTAEVTTAVRAAVGCDFYLGVRLSQGKVNDFDYLWPNGAEDAEVIFSAVQTAGADAIHFASEGLGFERGCLTADGQSLPRLARQLTRLPVIANGGMHLPHASALAIDDGHGDMVSLGTGAIANPDWPKRLASGTELTPVRDEMFSLGVTVEAVAEWFARQAA